MGFAFDVRADFVLLTAADASAGPGPAREVTTQPSKGESVDNIESDGSFGPDPKKNWIPIKNPKATRALGFAVLFISGERPLRLAATE